MIPLSGRDLQILMAAAIFVMGSLCMLMGILLLITRGYSREVKTLASQTAKLGQKGLAEEIAGLVTSASDLVASINGLVRTASGVGIFLITLGVVMMAASYWVIQQLQWVS
jgi:hypothetical protein